MAPTPKETLQGIYDLFSKGETQKMLQDYCTEDFDWWIPGDTKTLPWYSCKIQGHEEAQKHFEEMLKAIDVPKTNIKQIIIEDMSKAAEQGGVNAAVVITFLIIHKQTKKELEHDACHAHFLVEQEGHWKSKVCKCFTDSAQMERLQATDTA